MFRIFAAVVISICFTALKIYADCGLPTGGACSIEALKQKQQENLEYKDYIREFNEKYYNSDKSQTQKDLQEQVNLDLLKNINLQKN